MKIFTAFLLSSMLISCVKYDEGLPMRKGAVGNKIVENWKVTHFILHGFNRLDYRPGNKFTEPCDGANGTLDSRKLSKEFNWDFHDDGTWNATNKYRHTWNTFLGYENGDCLWEARAIEGQDDFEGTWEVDEHNGLLTIDGLPYQGLVQFKILKLTNKEMKLFAEFPSTKMAFSKR
jgi:hypothetical protein